MEFNKEIKDDFDHTIYENGNAYIALRKIKWNNAKEFKLDLRNYTTTSDGEERMGKGICFNNEAASEIINVLLEDNIGNTKDIIERIKDREDFNISIVKAIDIKQIELFKIMKEDTSLITEDDDCEFYDIRKEML